MANMPYCRFENTEEDLRDCVSNWHNVNSESEKKAKQNIIELAQTILEIEGWELNNPMQD